MEKISSLLEVKEVKSKTNSERAEVIRYFVENLRNKKGKPFSARMIAIKLSHIPTQDLYFMKSCFADRLHRQGIETAQKHFWWSIRK